LDGSVRDLADLCREAPVAARKSATMFLERFGFCETGEEESLSARLRLPYSITGSPRLWAGFVLAQIVAPEEADWTSVRIPWPPLFFLYYPWRLARLAWKWGRRGVRSVRNPPLNSNSIAST